MKEPILPPMHGAIVPEIGKTMKFIDIMVKAQFAKNGIDLTKEQFVLLRFLDQGPKPQSSLALITERDKGSLTRLVQSLERKKFIKRTVSKSDQRVNLVEMTPLGEKVALQARPIILSIIETLQNGVNEKDKEVTKRVLQCIRTNAEAALSCEK